MDGAIARVKGYAILDFIQAHYCTLVTKILQVCASLVTLQNSFIREVAEATTPDMSELTYVMPNV